MLNIVVPMAGRGSRFANAGYELPKPLIEIGGYPMIQIVSENLRPSQPHRFIYICLKEHVDQYNVDQRLRAISPGCEVVLVEGVTQGAACTVLLASDFIDNDDPLMIANSDQWIDVCIDEYLDALSNDGLIMTMTADDPKWSYVQFDASKEICGVVEKQVVSNEATVGIYNFRRGSDFVSSAKQMIREDLRVNGEFYVAPTYNNLLSAEKRLDIFNIGSERNGMHGIGIPQDLEHFKQTKSYDNAMRLVASATRNAA